MDYKHALIHAGVGALAGWANAAQSDYAAFKNWQSFADVKAYKWDIAIFNWVKGAIIGAVVNGSAGAVV